MALTLIFDQGIVNKGAPVLPDTPPQW